MSRPRVLVTRPEPGAAATAARLDRAGFAPLVASLTTIAPVAFDSAGLRPQAIALTSANAARGLERFSGLPVFAVGEATARAAQSYGAGEVVTGPGDARGLAQRILDSPAGTTGPVLYFRAERVAFDLVAALRAEGRHADERVVYRVARAENAEAALRPLAEGGVQAVTIHAASAARVLATVCAGNAAVEHGCRAAALAGVSENAVAPLAGVKFSSTMIAQFPDDDALIAALCTAFPRQ